MAKGGVGETFGDYVSPPVPFEDASPHECCEVVWAVAGRDVTPARLAALGEDQLSDLARKFSEYFECDAPTVGRFGTRSPILWRGGRWVRWANPPDQALYLTPQANRLSGSYGPRFTVDRHDWLVQLWQRCESRGDADEFQIFGGAPFRITAYRYQPPLA